MIRIRTKLMLFFLVIIFLTNAVAYFLFQNGQRSIDQYDQFLQRYFLVNKVSQTTDLVYIKLNDYMVEHSPEYYDAYLNERKDLEDNVSALSKAIKDNTNQIDVDNYMNMITSYLDESGIVSDAFRNQEVDVYSEHLSEVLKIKQYIQNATLTLINSELTHYQGFYHDLNEKNHYYQSMGISMFVATILLAVLFALWFSRGITRPIGRLTHVAREISKGNFEGPPVIANTQDEMRFLATTFNDMRSNIRGLIKEIEKKSELDQLLKEMELKNLQSQINPHFLFNVLNTMSKTAYLEGAERTSDLITSVATMLRHNLRTLDQPTTLQQEVDSIQEYFFLQKARFGERVRFKIETDDAVMDTLVPNLILQPIIENAFNHGIESSEDGASIRLEIRDGDTHVHILVSDNGVGMDEATKQRLERLEDRQEQSDGNSQSTGLGFINVMKRLQLYYGIRDFFTIASKKGEGTEIRIKLPKIP